MFVIALGFVSLTVIAQEKGETTTRLTEKVERITKSARKWAASGRDPAVIVKTIQDKFQPLMLLA